MWALPRKTTQVQESKTELSPLQNSDRKSIIGHNSYFLPLHEFYSLVQITAIYAQQKVCGKFTITTLLFSMKNKYS